MIEIADPTRRGSRAGRGPGADGGLRLDRVHSANAVERFWRSLGDGRGLGGAKLAVIGDATAAALADHGVVADLVPEQFVAESLVEAFPDPARAGVSQVLLPCAAEARDVLPQGLRAKGWRVEVVETYRTVRPTRDETGSERARGRRCRHVHVVVDRCRLPRARGAAGVPPVVACIGPVTARTAMKAGLKVDVVALGSHRRGAGGGACPLGGRQGRTGPAEVGSAKWVSLLAECGACGGSPPCAVSWPSPPWPSTTLWRPFSSAKSISAPVPIDSLPGVSQHTVESLVLEGKRLASLGIGALVLFGVPGHKDPVGSGHPTATALSRSPSGNCATASATSSSSSPISAWTSTPTTDTAECWTSAVSVDNDATLVRYGEVAVAQAEAGAHLVAPSGMMDGQVAAIRSALDASGHDEVGILAYSAKYASALYGPFRDAVDVTIAGGGDRKAYQQDPKNRREALEEVRLDVAEGADLVMVKPALAYLDVIAAVRAAVEVPVAAYNVSGEYAMVVAAAERGWIDREAVALEHLGAIKRAGAGRDPHLLRRRGGRGTWWLSAAVRAGPRPVGAAQSCSSRPAG